MESGRCVFEYPLAEALRDLFSSVFAESMKKQASLLVLYHKAKNKQNKELQKELNLDFSSASVMVD